MKKILFTGLVLSSCLLMASCGTTSEDAAIKNLSNQIDKLNNVVANATVLDTNEFNYENSSINNNDENIREIYQKTQSSIGNHNSYKEKILSKTATIKNRLASPELKIGNQNIKAVRELSNTLSKYTTKLANTNNDYKRTAKTVSNMKKNTNTNTSMLGAKLTRLSSCVDSRSCYYNNLLGTLSQLENLLNSGAVVENNVLNNDYLSNYNLSPKTNIYDNNGVQIEGSYCQNGICYDKNGNVMTGCYFDENGNCVSGNCEPNQAYHGNNSNITNQSNEYIENNTQNNISNNNQGLNQNQYNYRYRTPNHQNGNYNNGYRYNTMNPDRNTDTYAPGISNIDTYRNNHVNNGFNYNISETQDVINNEIDDTTKDLAKTETATLEEQPDNNITQNNAIKNPLLPNTEINTKVEENKPQTLEIKEDNIVATNETSKKEANNQTETKKLSEEEIALLSSTEDGKKDRDPRMKNLRHVEEVKERNNENKTEILSKNKKITKHENKLSPDYKNSNKKIKELIQSSAPVDEQLISNNIFAL